MTINLPDGSELLKKNEELEKQNALLKAQVDDLIKKNSISNEEFSNVETLNTFITRFIKFDNLSDIYKYVTSFLSDFLSDTIILFNSVDEEKKIVKLENIEGIDNKLLKILIKKNKINPLGKVFKLIDSHDNYFRQGKLIEFQGGLAEFAYSDLTPSVAGLIQKIIGLHKIYTIGIVSNHKLLAEVHFFTLNKKEITCTHFIDAIANVAGLLIQKKITDNILRDSEWQYHNIFDNSTIGIYRTSPEGKIILANQSLVKIFGYDSLEELQRINVENDIYTSQKQRQIFSEQIEILGQVNGIELEAKRKDGSIIYIRESAKIIRDDNGQILYYEGVVEDISEKKIAELNLRISKESYFDIFNSVSEAIYIQDPESGIFIDVNAGAAKIYECNREDLIGQSPATVAATGMNNLDEIVENSVNVFKTGVPARFNFWAVKKTGEVFPKEVIVNKGRYFGMEVLIATARDITENLKIQENILFQSKFQQILIEISSSYINMPSENIFISTNRLLEEIGSFFGASRCYIFDLDASTTISSNTYEWCNDKVSPQIENLQNINLPVRWVEEFKNGKSIYIYDVSALPDGYEKEVLKSQEIKSLIAVPMLNKSVPIGLIGLDFIDKFHKYSEEEYKLLSLASQILVNIKLRLKTEKELLEAKVRAEENDRLKSAFLANISHEIRTPMNGILGFAELLKDSNFSSQEKDEFVELIQKSGDRMLNIINDIINISKIESGIMEVDIKETNINKLLVFIHDFFKHEAKKKNIELRMLKPPTEDVVTFKTDEEKLIAILTNLIKNAIKFTEQGYVEFGYNMRDSDILFYVKDTGIGIPVDKIESIFHRFVQVDVENKSAYQGAGLGLPISKAFVELLGGGIFVESELGKGSKFYFTLPYSNKRVNIAAKDIANDLEAEIKPEKKYKILLADDDEASAVFISIALKEFAEEFAWVKSGREAIEFCRNNPDTDLLLTDIRMPDINGYEATQKIREFNKDIVIIAQTANALESDREKSISSGCDDYIAKPISVYILKKSILNQLKKKQKPSP